MTTPDTSALLPLTGAQRGIFDAQLIDPHSPYYVVGEVLELEGRVDTAALVRAIEATQREVETLRIRLRDTEGGPRQYLSEEIVPVIVRDLRGVTHPRRLAEARIDAAKTALAEGAAGLTEAALCRYEVLRLDEQRTWVIQLYHHIVVDGYSATLITRRMAEHYRAEVTGKAPKRYRGVGLAELVAEDSAYAASEEAEAARAFFRDLLTPLPDLAARERLNAATGGAQTSGTTITTTVRVSAQDYQCFSAAVEQAGSTWVSALVAVYAAQLWQITGRPQEDLCLAMPVMARTTRAQRATPHMAVNVLPLLVPVRAEATLRDLLAETDERFRQVRQHQRYRGENLPRDLGVPGAGALLHGMGVNAKIFDMTFDFAGATGALRNVAGGPPEDFGLVVMPAADGGLDLGLETDPARVPAPVARQRLSELRDLLAGFSGEATVGELVGATDDTEALIDARAAQPATASTEPTASLRDLIDALATQEEESLIAQDTRLSGAELHRRVIETALHLPQGQPIAIDMPRGSDLVVTVLAALYAGVPFTYLEPGAPRGRRQAIMEALGATWVAGRNAFPAAEQERRELQATELAYVIFTSGSTGTPKGVEITRASLEALLTGHLAGLYRRPRAVVGHTASFAFDAALDQLLWLLAGHCVRLYPEEIATDAEAAVAALRADEVTVFDTTPSLAAALMAAGLVELPELELLVLGGEALPAPLWDALAGSRVRALNAYGPTEACVDALMAEVTPGQPVIGYPVAGMRAYALTENNQVAGDFESGRLYLAGPQLARGYLDEEATAQAFITRTVDPRRGPERLYDTGDMVRWIPGRGYEYLGRVDDQVEINGRRVELGEIEAALAATEGVAAAVATVHGRAGLVGWVVPASGATLTPGAVREAVAAQLPKALVPGRIEVIADLPTTVSGKVDRKALAAREQGDDSPVPVNDETPAEAALLAACREQTGAVMAPTGDFISQGGDSISALTVATQLRREGWTIWPKNLLSGASLGSVAAAMEQAGTQGAEQEEEFFLPIGALPESPVAARQRAAAPDAEAWAGFAQYAEIPGPQVSPEVLPGILAQLSAAHGALRMILDTQAGELIVPRVSLVELEESTEPSPVRDLAQVAARSGLLAPEAGRMAHLVALEHGGVGLIVHHSAVDALSWRVLRAEVTRILRGGKLNSEQDGWRAHALRSARGDHRAEIPHWLRVQRAGRPTEPQPHTLPTRAEATTVTLEIPPAAARALTESPEEVMLAALARSTGALLGVEGHGRSSDQSTVGWFTIEYPLAVEAPHSTDPLADTADALAAARRARHEVPGTGGGYGVLAAHDSAGALHGIGLRYPEVVLNVLPGDTGEFAVVDHPRRRLTEALTVNVFVGTGRIEYTADPVRFDPARLHEEIVCHLLRVQAVRAGQVPEASIRHLEQAHGPIEATWPLTPQQEGLVFHALSASEDPYVLAMRLDLRASGPIDVPRLRAAWEQLLRRHRTLAAGFDAAAGLQFLPRHLPETFRLIDARGLGSAHSDLVVHLMARESTRRVDLAAPPLVRVTAVIYEEDRLHLVLAGHHVVTDGWSTGLMIRELNALYSGAALPPAPQPEIYLDWLARHREADVAVWREHLDGLEGGTLVAPEAVEASTGGEEFFAVDVAEHAEALVDVARESGATAAELLQVAWAYVLAELTDSTGEVVCGVTVSGRPPEVPEAAEMIGLFAATLPARIAVSGDPLADLRAHHAARAHLGQHTAVSAADVGGAGLFDTIVVYENAPTPQAGGELTVEGTESFGQTHYPITVLSQPGRDFDVVLAYRPGLVDTERARWAANRLGQVLRSFLGEGLPEATPPRAAVAPMSVTQEKDRRGVDKRRAAPGTAELIAAEMSALLDSEVGPETNFAEAGGHSLLAVRLLGRLQGAGLDIAIGDILAGGSPRGIAARLGVATTDAATSPSPLLARSVGGRTLWCMPPGDGLHAPWAELAAQIPLNVRAVTWGGEIEQGTLAQAAQDVAALIRAEQPQGPYCLLGWSFGGALAHAVAHALGGPEQVEFLGIVDSYPAGAAPQGLTEGADPTPLVEGLLNLDDEATPLRELVEHNLIASSRLMAEAPALPWEGRVHLVVGTKPLGAAAEQDETPTGPTTWDPAAAWERAGAQVEALDVEADHFELVSPEGWRTLGPFIAGALAQARSAQAHTHSQNPTGEEEE
ncbi:condensation domain-containing protein [Corynebacterium lowii]|uniref:Linear gramicidin synthase subunit D n=1 Tax=Corynebacterium lowii TaxID=1544413 RepID=A0A0Q0UC79_9CORY|nr:condensation domain-containing protein [Corynebacterium lowii]KQB83981.1 Linear gramicidin synthase subunit D [Corynebacterium lowii]MDP9852769.1 amino acid adenylation domain-containing protein [Corynebacterium lowii]